MNAGKITPETFISYSIWSWSFLYILLRNLKFNYYDENMIDEIKKIYTDFAIQTLHHLYPLSFFIASQTKFSHWRRSRVADVLNPFVSWKGKILKLFELLTPTRHDTLASFMFFKSYTASSFSILDKVYYKYLETYPR